MERYGQKGTVGLLQNQTGDGAQWAIAWDDNVPESLTCDGDGAWEDDNEFQRDILP